MENAYTIATLRATVAPIAKAHGVSRVYLFGSRARGTSNIKSDIDLRIDKGGIRSLFELSSFRLDLEDALGARVDLITSDVPDSAFLNRIAKDEVLLYEG